MPTHTSTHTHTQVHLHTQTKSCIRAHTHIHTYIPTITHTHTHQGWQAVDFSSLLWACASVGHSPADPSLQKLWVCGWKLVSLDTFHDVRSIADALYGWAILFAAPGASLCVVCVCVCVCVCVFGSVCV